MQDLHSYLGCTRDLANALRNLPNSEIFQVHKIPKHGGGIREVWEVRDPFADIYKGLGQHLQELLVQAIAGYPHPCSQGYLPKRSIYTNAKVHLGARLILRADIKSFFQSINTRCVRKFLLKLGLTSAAANALIAVVVRDNHLPLGLHTSPIIANAICHELDVRLSSLPAGGHYTRYADDLTFSGPRLPTIDEVSAVTAEFGFSLAPAKCGVLRAGRGLYVTGLSIEDGKAPRVPKAMKRRIRQELYYVERLGLEAHIGRRYGSIHSGINYIHGTIQFIRGIERELGNRLHQSWITLLKRSGLEPSYPSFASRAERTVYFVIDESKIDGPSGAVLALALIAIEDPLVIAKCLNSFAAECLARPFPSTATATLAKQGLHWNTLTVDDRTRITEFLQHLPFRGFIAYAQISSEDRKTYTAKYRDLLKRLLNKRFLRYDSAKVRVFAEKNSKVAGGTLSKTVVDEYQRFERLHSRKPKESPECHIVGKIDEPTLPLADLVLGIFGDYARVNLRIMKQGHKRPPGAQAIQRFAMIRTKIRAIYDLDSETVYSRKRTFCPWPQLSTLASSGDE
jgi:retron-type reverse transcriptase